MSGPTSNMLRSKLWVIALALENQDLITVLHMKRCINSGLVGPGGQAKEFSLEDCLEGNAIEAALMVYLQDQVPLQTNESTSSSIAHSIPTQAFPPISQASNSQSSGQASTSQPVPSSSVSQAIEEEEFPGLDDEQILAFIEQAGGAF